MDSDDFGDDKSSSFWAQPRSYVNCACPSSDPIGTRLNPSWSCPIVGLSAVVISFSVWTFGSVTVTIKLSSLAFTLSDRKSVV